ncbi:kinase-like domain-containing protein [Mycena capillaripes]|nr:kinase-like domain-containing protein [Mycena capillaripes]
MSPAVLPLKAVERIVYHVYLSCLSQFNTNTIPGNKHLCSPAIPCRGALHLLLPLLTIKLVASSWNTAVKNFQQSKHESFFSRIEDEYYPHAWHVNTRTRKALLLSRYRVFRTIHSEDGNRGVYLAYDIGGADGCASPREVIVKAWVAASDFECQREITAYCALGGAEPAQHDPLCDVHTLILPKLGPTLEDLRALLPSKRLDAQMVLMVAIQMIERCRDIHARGLVHSGIKPANICLAPEDNPDAPSMLYAIDFGFSSALDANSRFMSVFAHHGISKFAWPSQYALESDLLISGQSQRDDLESLAYLLSYLFHSGLPWDNSTNGVSKSRSSGTVQHQPHVWRIKIATPAAVLFRHMDECFYEFWRDVKALAYAEVPDYDRMKARFEVCLEERNKTTPPVGWWDIWNKWNK